MACANRVQHSAAYCVALLTFATMALQACGSIESSTMATHGAMAAYRGNVALSGLASPAGAQELGLVTTTALVGEEWKDVLDAFRAAGAELGGDFVTLDNLGVTFDMVTSSQVQSYSCGTTNAPRTCTRTVQQTSEVGHLTLNGRAFRTRAP